MPAAATANIAANTRNRTPAAQSRPTNRISRQIIEPRSLYPTMTNSTPATGNNGIASARHAMIS